MRAVCAGVLLTLALAGCSGSPPVPRTARGGLSDHELAAAAAIARDVAWEQEAEITSATVTAIKDRVTESNTGYTCESERLLHIRLIGTFPHITTTGHPLEPSSLEDLTVHAVTLTADAESGRVCEMSVRTGDVAPKPDAVVIAMG